jgi:hypothetical protein
LDQWAYAELTTSTVPTGEAFAYWRELRHEVAVAG